jgi:hypothetical protein
MNRKQLSTVLAAAAVLVLLAFGAASALAVPPTCNPGDPDCDPDPGPVTTTQTVHLTVAQPSQGTIVDAAAPAPSSTGQINCGADCSQSYTYEQTCDGPDDCTESDVDNELLTATGGPAGYSPVFHVCNSNATGTTCTGEIVCGSTCSLSMDQNYRARVEWVDTTPPDTPTVTGPDKAGPTARHFSATATDNAGVTGMRFYLDDVLQSTDTTAPYEYDLPVESTSTGSHVVKARALDAAGNQSDSAGSKSVSVDKSATVAITAPADGGQYQAAPSVTFTHDGDVGTIVCQTLKGGTVVSTASSCTTSFTPDLAGKGDGDYTARVDFTDDVGNEAVATRAV